MILNSCEHAETDEPDKTMHRPGGDSDDNDSNAGNDNPNGGNGDNSPNEGNGDNGPNEGGEGAGDNNSGSTEGDDPIENSPIVGRWIMVKTGEQHIFEADGRYSSPPLLNGYYTYDDLHRWLYISIDNGKEVYAIEYKCLIEEGTMTWYDEAGREYELRKDS